MQNPRLPRFTRSTKIDPVQLTSRDRAIIRLVDLHRFLRSSHIIDLLGESRQAVLRRLRLLYHHGYLERPRAQIDYFHTGGSREIVYGLGNKGGRLLKDMGFARRPLSWGEKNRAIGRFFLEHALLVSDVLVAIELSCRKTPNVRFIPGEELLQGTKDGKRLAWSVQIQGNRQLGIVPDGLFAIERTGPDRETERAYFFLEADRGTMPIVRKNLSQTSFFRKLLAYEATWSQGIHRTHFGFHRFRVLTVTKSQARRDALVQACQQLKGGHGLFLFSDQASYCSAPNVFEITWKSGRNGDDAILLP